MMRLIMIIAAILMVWALLSTQLPRAVDWEYHFRSASLNLANPTGGKNYNPPWLYVLLWPLAKLPGQWGRGGLATLTLLIALMYVKSPLRMLALCLSAPMVCVMWQGQVDAISLLALMLPPALSLPFFAIKPQGCFLAGLRRVTPRSLAALGAVVAASIAIWGTWWVGLVPPRGTWWNLSLWPWSIPLGLVLAVVGRRNDALLCIASLCLTPYFGAQSLLPAVAASGATPFLATAVSWVFVLWRRAL